MNSDNIIILFYSFFFHIRHRIYYSYISAGSTMYPPDLLYIRRIYCISAGSTIYPPDLLYIRRIYCKPRFLSHIRHVIQFVIILTFAMLLK